MKQNLPDSTYFDFDADFFAELPRQRNLRALARSTLPPGSSQSPDEVDGFGDE